MYDNLRRDLGRQPYRFVEFTINSVTYRFSQVSSPVPPGLDAMPVLTSVSTSPTAIDYSGGIGARATLSCAMSDFIDSRYYGTPGDPLQFWPVWRANNLNYIGVPIIYYEGYLDSNNDYHAENFQQRLYLIETFSHGAGGVNIGAKDPLKLADNARAQTPVKSRGALDSDLLSSAGSFTMANNSGDYPASGEIRINSEVLSFTRSGTTFTITRAQRNTTADDHGEGDTVQLCTVINAPVEECLRVLLEDVAGIDPSYLDVTQWGDELQLYYPGNFEIIITEPEGVADLIKELSDSAPFYMYWEERAQKVLVSAIKPAPEGLTDYTDEGALIENKFKYKDSPGMRISTVVVNYGQYDPTKKKDEFSNYTRGYIREDPTSFATFGGRIKTINSRWIQSTNGAAAIRAAVIFGRRFHSLPRLFDFSLDAKDSELWTGSHCRLTHNNVVDTTGDPAPTPVQVLTAAESGDHFSYTAVESFWGPELAGDVPIGNGEKLVVLSGEILDTNLRTIFEGIYGTPLVDDIVIFVLDTSCVAGSTSISIPAVTTGTWPELTTPPVLDMRGILVGRAGDHNDIAGVTNGNGGDALNVEDDITLKNTGIIGGGGGGGGDSSMFGLGDDVARASGGAGAGFQAGTIGLTETSASGQVNRAATRGTLTAGGVGGFAIDGEALAIGGDAGDLGQDGQTGQGDGVNAPAGLAGRAIVTNGHTVTYDGGQGDVRGAIV